LLNVKLVGASRNQKVKLQLRIREAVLAVWFGSKLQTI
jgi:hypothetical protein